MISYMKGRCIQMDKNTLQMGYLILLIIFFLALVLLTILYIRRWLAIRRESTDHDMDRWSEEIIQEEQIESKGYWLNKDDMDEEDQTYRLRYYHYFDNIDECIHDLIVEMYDCGFVRTEDIFVAAYGEDALKPDSFIYMTDDDPDFEKAKAALPPVSEKNQKIIYDLWVSYVEELLDRVEIHTTPANQDIIKDALMVYGRKKIGILLRSPE